MKLKKRLPKGKRNKKIKQMLEDGFSYDEIQEELGVARKTIAKMSKALKEAALKKQQEMDLQSKEQLAKAELVQRYDYMEPKIKHALAVAEDVENNVNELKEKAVTLDELITANITKKEELRNKAFDYVISKLDNEEIDAAILAKALVKE